ncbi:trk system potassium uptake protein TrkA [Kibdelosporangium banguiense]|uniref:Trk system potassium uptake protein TrkA n=1 Tax=Kibdelosporangium banguiense TaxID=1365924 RepID=A0ABS4TXW7_9PSEU|nr:NAD-binding protein [Kibdelosporangium banguiense]MBP2328781.1 trk system potassium uptake protein TrkA [Kibdelosporangium banguiense]
MKILIVGTGRLGEQAAHLLAATGHEVTVVDRDQHRLDRLGTAYRLVRGDACEPPVLEAAGALRTHLLLAATGEDEDNLVISLLAKRQFGVRRVLARVNDPDNAWLFAARWGVDVALPAAAPLVSLIEEAAGVTDTVGLVRLAAAGVELIETRIGDSSAAAGRQLADLEVPAGTVVATVVHDGQPMVPSGDYRFHPGDTVLVVTSTATDSDIHKVFQ